MTFGAAWLVKNGVDLAAPREDTRKRRRGKRSTTEKGTAEEEQGDWKRKIEAQTNYMATIVESIVNFGRILLCGERSALRGANHS